VGELAAILLSFSFLSKHHLPHHSEWHILTDSAYVIGQLDRGDRTNANRELVQQLKSERIRLQTKYSLRGIFIDWVPGHSGLRGNTRVDELAKWEATRQQQAKQAKNEPCHKKIKMEKQNENQPKKE